MSTKKFTSVVLTATTSVWMSGAMLLVPVASAQSTADLQAQIAALLAQIQALQSQLSSQSGAPAACSFTRDLTAGSKGDDVKCLQQTLNANGFKVSESGAGSAGNETTYFGPATKAALAKWQAAKGISPAVGYFGPKSRAALATATPPVATPPGAPPGTPPVSVPATGLAVSNAADSPASATLPRGAAAVPLLKFNVAGKGMVNAVTVKRVGAGATADFSNVYLYEGGSRLTSGRSVNSSSHEANFTGLNLSVDGVKTLTISADIAAGATAANRNGFNVTAVSADVAVSGLPVMGAEVVISGATAGTLTATKTGSLSNPNIGQQNAQVSQFRLSAANEDVKVMRVSLFYAGTVSKTNLGSFVLKNAAGDTLATAGSINAKDLVVFELGSPVMILKGDSKDFYVYANIGGSAKKDETVKLYVEEASDVYGVGQQFGFGATVTKGAFDSDAADHHVLTLQGGTLTTSFLGPNASDIRKNGKDVTLFEFTMASANNLEVRKLNASVATTAGSLTGDDSLTDFKVVDVATGVVVAGPTDLTFANINGQAGVSFTDIFNVTAGQSRRLKITADIPNNWDDGDAIRVTLTAFTAGADVKNLDNNTFLAAAEIVPSTALTGNAQTVKAPTLELSLSGTPTSQTFVKGTQMVPFVGFGLRAIADDIKVNTIKITSTSSSVTDANQIADMLNLALYDGDTRVSDIKSLTTANASSATATFTNLQFKITKGTSKVLTVKGNLSATAVTNNRYEIGLAQATVTNNTTGNDVVAVDSEGNEPTYTGSFAGSGVNMASNVQITVSGAGTITVATAPDDTESKAGIVSAGTSKVVLGKFKFTAATEALTVKKLKLLVNNESSTAAAATSTVEVSKVYLFDGSTQLGSTNGYSPVGSGAAAGEVTVEDLSWLIGKDQTKTLTVKADTTTIAAGATTGRSLFAHVRPTGFEASGAATTVTNNGAAGGAKGNEKVLYKTYPAITVASAGTLLTSGSNDLLKFTVTNKTSNEILSWNTVSFNINTAAATAPLFGANVAAFTLRDLTNGANLTIGTTATGGTSTAGTYIIVLTNEESIPAGQAREYRLTGTVTAPGQNSSVSTQLVLRVDATTASIKKGVAWRSAAGNANTGVDGAVNAEDAGFVWSDNSATGHTLLTTDWANGVYVETFPSDTLSRAN